MKWTIIILGPARYHCRLIPDLDADHIAELCHDLLVAPIESKEPIQACNPYLDELICYYADAGEMALSDQRLFDCIYK